MKGPMDYDFTPYLIYDNNGMWAGIRDDAPEEAKKAYAKFTKKRYIKGMLVK